MSDVPYRSQRGAVRESNVITIIMVMFFSVLLVCPQVSGDSETEESAHDYHNNEWTFLVISLLMAYAVSALIAGIFTMKYGQGRSRILAGAMFASGLLIWGIWIYFKLIISATYPDDTFFGIIYWSTAPLLKPLFAAIGVLLGAGFALFLFLTFVVRS